MALRYFTRRNVFPILKRPLPTCAVLPPDLRPSFVHRLAMCTTQTKKVKVDGGREGDEVAITNKTTTDMNDKILAECKSKLIENMEELQQLNVELRDIRIELKKLNPKTLRDIRVELKKLNAKIEMRKEIELEIKKYKELNAKINSKTEMRKEIQLEIKEYKELNAKTKTRKETEPEIKEFKKFNAKTEMLKAIETKIKEYREMEKLGDLIFIGSVVFGSTLIAYSFF